MDPPSDRSYIDSVVRYYDRTWFDYRLVWVRHRNYMAMHWGYWDENTKTHTESLLNMNRAVATKGDLRPGMRVLDAGCGNGGTATWIAETYRVHVVGVTLSADQVANASNYARRRGVQDLVSFEQQDFTSLSFPDRSFDAVWAQESVCHVPEEGKADFLREAHRVLKPGGRLVVEDWFRMDRPYSAANETLMKEWLSGWAIEDLATGKEFIGWAREIGFSEVQLEDITPHAHRSMVRLRRLALACYVPGLLLRAVRIRSAEEHGNLRAAWLHWPAHKRNLWFIGIFSARKEG